MNCSYMENIDHLSEFPYISSFKHSDQEIKKRGDRRWTLLWLKLLNFLVVLCLFLLSDTISLHSPRKPRTLRAWEPPTKDRDDRQRLVWPTSEQILLFSSTYLVFLMWSYLLPNKSNSVFLIQGRRGCLRNVPEVEQRTGSHHNLRRAGLIRQHLRVRTVAKAYTPSTSEMVAER